MSTMSESTEDLDDLWDDDLRDAINDLWARVHNHPDDCTCRDCAELAELAFK